MHHDISDSLVLYNKWHMKANATHGNCHMISGILLLSYSTTTHSSILSSPSFVNARSGCKCAGVVLGSWVCNAIMPSVVKVFKYDSKKKPTPNLDSKMKWTLLPTAHLTWQTLHRTRTRDTATSWVWICFLALWMPPHQCVCSSKQTMSWCWRNEIGNVMIVSLPLYRRINRPQQASVF